MLPISIVIPRILIFFRNQNTMKISPGTVFITGCNRGIGLEIVKQMLNLGTPPVSLFANYRQEPGELKEGKAFCKMFILVSN